MLIIILSGKECGMRTVVGSSRSPYNEPHYYFKVERIYIYTVYILCIYMPRTNEERAFSIIRPPCCCCCCCRYDQFVKRANLENERCQVFAHRASPTPAPRSRLRECCQSLPVTFEIRVTRARYWLTHTVQQCMYLTGARGGGDSRDNACNSHGHSLERRGRGRRDE